MDKDDIKAGGSTRPLWTPLFAKPHVGSKPEGHLAYQYRSSFIQPAADSSMLGFQLAEACSCVMKAFASTRSP
jgi:hypothetical protein